MIRYLAMVGLTLAVACGGVATGPKDMDTAAATLLVRRGESIQLSVGKQARLGSSGPVVQFRAVREDSRCPQAVDCVWNGDAIIELTVLSVIKTETLLLHTEMEPRRATIGDHVLVLEALDPRPISGQLMDSSQYRARFRLESR